MAIKVLQTTTLFARRSAHGSNVRMPLAISQRMTMRSYRMPPAMAYDTFARKSLMTQSSACTEQQWFSTINSPSPRDSSNKEPIGATDEKKMVSEPLQPTSEATQSKSESMQTTSESMQTTSSLSFLDRVVAQLNDSIKKHPAETLAVLFASDIGSIGAMYGVLTLTGIEFSPEFALAFAVSRPFRRFRLPLDLAAAAAVSKVFPVFSRVRLSDLSDAQPRQPVSDTSASSWKQSLATRAMNLAKYVVYNYGAAYMMVGRPFRRFSRPIYIAALAVASKVLPLVSDLTGVQPRRPVQKAGASWMTPAFVTKAMNLVTGAVDNYGAAYMMGSRLVGVGVVCGLDAVIEQSINVMPLLTTFGVGDYGTTLGMYAAAIVFSPAFYPVTLGATGYVVPIVAKARRIV